MKWLLGINWKTTLAGITMIIAVVGKILLAYRTKDFATIFSNGQEMIVDVTLLLGALGLIKAKDGSTTGVGANAVSVDSSGTGTNVAGQVVKVSLLLVAGLTLVTIYAMPARAQTKSNELSIGAAITRQSPHFTQADFKYNQSTDQIGADFSATHYFGESVFGFTLDVGASAKGGAATDASLLTAAIGPTVKARNWKKFQPFARVLIGGARFAARNQQLKFDKTNIGFALIAGGGVDWTLSDRFAVRVLQADFLGTRTWRLG
jgi:uncharacterized membrane protein